MITVNSNLAKVYFTINNYPRWYTLYICFFLYYVYSLIAYIFVLRYHPKDENFCTSTSYLRIFMQAVYDANKLFKLVDEKKKMHNWLDYYQLKYVRDPSKRPTLKVLYLQWPYDCLISSKICVSYAQLNKSKWNHIIIHLWSLTSWGFFSFSYFCFFSWALSRLATWASWEIGWMQLISIHLILRD